MSGMLFRMCMPLMSLCFNSYFIDVNVLCLRHPVSRIAIYIYSNFIYIIMSLYLYYIYVIYIIISLCYIIMFYVVFESTLLNYANPCQNWTFRRFARVAEKKERNGTDKKSDTP